MARPRTVDVFVENYGRGVTARLGIGYESAKEIRPKLIQARNSGLGGQTYGSRRRRISFRQNDHRTGR
jgi:crotonobetainyl-CoA:carnitine CoA-transferase CaiB-like acyl-CoA transferase